jgi:ribosomal protein L19E
MEMMISPSSSSSDESSAALHGTRIAYLANRNREFTSSSSSSGNGVSRQRGEGREGKQTALNFSRGLGEMGRLGVWISCLSIQRAMQLRNLKKEKKIEKKNTKSLFCHQREPSVRSRYKLSVGHSGLRQGRTVVSDYK